MTRSVFVAGAPPAGVNVTRTVAFSFPFRRSSLSAAFDGLTFSVACPAAERLAAARPVVVLPDLTSALPPSRAPIAYHDGLLAYFEGLRERRGAQMEPGARQVLETGIEYHRFWSDRWKRIRDER